MVQIVALLFHSTFLVWLSLKKTRENPKFHWWLSSFSLPPYPLSDQPKEFATTAKSFWIQTFGGFFRVPNIRRLGPAGGTIKMRISLTDRAGVTKNHSYFVCFRIEATRIVIENWQWYYHRQSKSSKTWIISLIWIYPYIEMGLINSSWYIMIYIMIYPSWNSPERYCIGLYKNGGTWVTNPKL